MLFSSNEASNVERVLDCVDVNVIEGMNRDLMKSFSKEEVKKVFQMHPTKPPWYACTFFQKYWSIIGDDVCIVILGVLNDNESLDGLNHTLITLIPKANKAKKSRIV